MNHHRDRERSTRTMTNTTAPVYAGRTSLQSCSSMFAGAPSNATNRVGSYAGGGSVDTSTNTCKDGRALSYNNYYQNTPLWSRPYTYCTSNADCGVDTVDAVRCLPINSGATSDESCHVAPPFSCICSNAVRAPF